MHENPLLQITPLRRQQRTEVDAFLRTATSSPRSIIAAWRRDQ